MGGKKSKEDKLKTKEDRLKAKEELRDRMRKAVVPKKKKAAAKKKTPPATTLFSIGEVAPPEKVEQPPEKPHLSATQVNMYLRCPRQYWFRYIRGLKISPDFGLILGRSFHKTLEENFQQKIDSHEDLKLPTMLEFFAEDFDQGSKMVEQEKVPGEEGKAKDDGAGLIELHRIEVAPTIQPTLVEEKISFEFAGIPFSFLGYLDLVNDVKEIIDHKTTKRSPNEKAIKTNFQMTSYAVGYHQRFGEWPAKIKTHNYVRTKTPKMVSLETLRDERDEALFLRIVGEVANGITKKVFPPNWGGTNCGWCGYRRLCEAGDW